MPEQFRCAPEQIRELPISSITISFPNGIQGGQMRLIPIFLALILTGCNSQPREYNIPIQAGNNASISGNIETRVDGIRVTVGAAYKPHVTAIIHKQKASVPEVDFEIANRASEQVVGCRGEPNAEQYRNLNSDPASVITVVSLTVAC